MGRTWQREDYIRCVNFILYRDNANLFILAEAQEHQECLDGREHSFHRKEHYCITSLKGFDKHLKSFIPFCSLV